MIITIVIKRKIEIIHYFLQMIESNNCLFLKEKKIAIIIDIEKLSEVSIKISINNI